jgi:hypothetical protein
MTNKVIISLVGEQPAPNVLPLEHYHPDQVVLVHTKRTELLADRIAKVVEYPVIRPFCRTDPYRVDEIRLALETYLDEYVSCESELIFNLTGGTKTMEYAALETARRRQARAFYYQTEENQSLLHPYSFDGMELICEEPIEIKTTLSIDQYLRVYVGEYGPDDKHQDLDFEPKVLHALQQLGPEYEVCPNLRLKGVSGNVEVDWVLRYRNTFAVGEVKTSPSKKSLDQLSSITHPATLGTYTRKFLVAANPLDVNNLDLAKAYNIEVIELSGADRQPLTGEQVQKLHERIRGVMEGRKR